MQETGSKGKSGYPLGGPIPLPAMQRTRFQLLHLSSDMQAYPSAQPIWARRRASMCERGSEFVRGLASECVGE